MLLRRESGGRGSRLPTLPTRHDVEQSGPGQPSADHRAGRLPDKGKQTPATGRLSRGARDVGCAGRGQGLVPLQRRPHRRLPWPVRVKGMFVAVVALRSLLVRLLAVLRLREVRERPWLRKDIRQCRRGHRELLRLRGRGTGALPAPATERRKFGWPIQRFSSTTTAAGRRQ